MDVLISARLHNRSQSLFRHTHKRMRRARSAHRVHSHPNRSVRPVLESNWERDTRREFSVQLRLGGAGPDGSPGDEVGNVLR